MPGKFFKANRHRGVYLLPNLFTTAGLFSGFYAIVASMNGDFQLAAIAIFVAMVFDGLDGRVARMTNTESEFGAEYDSMADIVSFGIAPALVAYNWALADLGKMGWLAAFIFVAGGALRLARFNTDHGGEDKRYFQGLAIPSAAAIVAGMVWVGAKYGIDSAAVSVLVWLFTVSCGLLMVSNFKYHSFKDVDWREKVNFLVILLIVLVFVIVATEPALVLFILFTAYAVSGPVNTFRHVSKVRLEHIIGDPDEDECHEHFDDADFTTSTDASKAEPVAKKSGQADKREPKADKQAPSDKTD